MQIKQLFEELGIDNLTDQVYLNKIINIFKHDKECRNFSRKTVKGLGRDYSSVRQRMKRIIDKSDEEKLEKILGAKKEKLSSKVFVQRMMKRVKIDE